MMLRLHNGMPLRRSVLVTVRFSRNASTAINKNEQVPFITWYYATDKPKRKIFDSVDEIPSQDSKDLSGQRGRYLRAFLANEEYLKKPAKKFKPFNRQDSTNLELKYQYYLSHMRRGDLKDSFVVKDLMEFPEKVLVNEDKLFQVDIHKWELEPIYWEGAVYEVRRGVWFTPDNIPVNSNIMIQIESHYQRLKLEKSKKVSSPSGSGNAQATAITRKKYTWKREEPFLPLYKLLEYSADYGSMLGENEEHSLLKSQIPKRKPTNYLYFNSEDPSLQTVFVIPHDQKNYYNGGIALNLLRNGIVTIGCTKLTRTIKIHEQENQQRKIDNEKSEELKKEELMKKEAYSVLDGFIPSSVASFVGRNWINALSGLGSGSSPSDAAEHRKADSKASDSLLNEQMEKDYDSSNTNNSDRDIEHLVFCVHGIGQTLGRKYQYVNFSHTINILRNNMKSLYKTSRELHHLNDNDHENSKIQVLPITWRHKIEFNTDDMDKNRNFEELPTLLDLSLDGVKPVRKLIGDIVLDVLLYDERYYREKIVSEVITELNRIHALYMENNPHFRGNISVIGHSLGSLIVFDILSHPELSKKLNFSVVNFFGIGSPVGVFKLIQRTMLGERPFQFSNFLNKRSQLVKYVQLDCENFYNVNHMCDPVGFRMEPLVDKRMRSIEQEYVTTLSTTNQIAAKVMEIGESLPTTTSSALQSSRAQLKSRLLKTEGVHMDILNGVETGKVSLNKDLLTKLGKINKKNGRVDYSLKTGLLEMDVVNAIKSHVSYFEDFDISGFLLRELLKKTKDISKLDVQLKK